MNNQNSEEPSHHPSLCLNRTCVRVERERENTSFPKFCSYFRKFRGEFESLGFQAHGRFFWHIRQTWNKHERAIDKAVILLAASSSFSFRYAQVRMLCCTYYLTEYIVEISQLCADRNRSLYSHILTDLQQQHCNKITKWFWQLLTK